MIDLKNILKMHPNCLSSRASFKSVLMDIYPDEKRTVNILTIMFECGVANKIKAKKTIDSNEMQGLIAQIENEYGISVRYAAEAVHIWATAYDVPIQETDVLPPSVSSGSTTIKPDEQHYIRQPRIRPTRNYVNSSNYMMTNTQPNVNQLVNGDELEWETSILPSGKLLLTKFIGVEDTEVIVPNYVNGLAVEAIGCETFSNCICIKRIIIQEGITDIQDGAFSGCTSLVSVFLPSSLKRLGSNAQISDKGVFEKTGLEDIILPDGLTYIAAKAFKNCQKLHTIHLPNSVKEICAEAFLGCARLDEVILPNGITFIGKNAFSKTNIEDVYIPDGVKVINNYTFYKCTRLKNVSLPDSIEKIGDYAFAQSGLLSIYIPDGVKVISNYTFYKCTRLKNVSLPDSIEKIDDYAFAQSGLLSAYIPDRTLHIGKYAFYQCNKLKEVSLPKNLQTVGCYAFAQTAIANIKIPGSISIITQNMFSSCEKLSSVILYEGVAKIDDFAFDDCKSLRDITIPMSVREISINAFNLIVKKNSQLTTQNIRQKNENLIIACFPGSVGLEYARKNSYKTKRATYNVT